VSVRAIIAMVLFKAPAAKTSARSGCAAIHRSAFRDPSSYDPESIASRAILRRSRPAQSRRPRPAGRRPPRLTHIGDWRRSRSLPEAP
jgi:hypothetical protein